MSDAETPSGTDRIVCQAIRHPYSRRVLVYVAATTPDKRFHPADPITYTTPPQNPGTGIDSSSPTFDLSEDEAVRFMQELWNMGVRPAQYENSERLVQTLQEEVHRLWGLVNKLTDQATK